MKVRNREMLKRNNVYTQKGITLIALVITIIILIILAGISISLVLGKNGIITKAKQAKTTTEQAKQNEEIGLNEATKYIEEMGVSGSATNPPETIKTVEEVKGGDYFEKPTTIKDSNGNTIEVPEGFKIAEDSGKNVTEGIVIEDNDIVDGIGNNRGNQYVWIPVGNGIKKSDGTTIDITLGRYAFANGTSDKDSSGNILAKGTPILKQNAENYTQEIVIDSYYKELLTPRIGVSSSNTNTTALNLKGFIDSVKENGGYYIARYEASYGTDGKVNSKVSNTFTDSNTAPTTRTEGMLWNFITQIDAATASRNLYTTATTDLINSYAWDTAIVYIQEFSGDIDYSKQNLKNTSILNTGTNGDEICKINDMASNMMEWTTEYSTNTAGSYAYPCTTRGGYYGDSSSCTSYRFSNLATLSYKFFSFRITLYM